MMEATDMDASNGESKPEPEVVCLLHTDWGCSLLRSLHQMQQDNSQCDVTLSNEDGSSISAHSIVLNAASRKLQSDLHNCGSQVLLKGVSSVAIHAMVDFIYVGHSKVTASELPAVQALAEHFEIPQLVEACCQLSKEAVQEKNPGAEPLVELAGKAGEVREGGPVFKHVKEEKAEDVPRRDADATMVVAKEQDHKKQAVPSAGPDTPVLGRDSRRSNKSVRGRGARGGRHGRKRAVTPRTAKNKAAPPPPKAKPDRQNQTGKTRQATGNVCQKCGRKFKFPEGLTRHLRNHQESDPLCCYLCSQVFINDDDLKSHVAEHQVPPNMLKCTRCDTVVSRPQDLRLHVAKAHGVKNQYKCKRCGEFFETRNSLVLHRQTHGGQKPFPCQYCGREFLWRSNLKDHIRTHTGERPFSCIHCAKTFSHDTNRKVHQRMHHADGSLCEDKVCNEARSLPKRKPPAFIYKCSVCSKEFNRKDSYTKHMHRHNGTHAFYCDYCGKGFMERECFETHVKGHQGIASSFRCDICDICVTTKKGLTKHMKTIHQRDKQYQCTECGVTFVHRSSFVAHNMMHAGRKPYSCEHCKRTFRCSSHLKGHLRIHTGEKPYGCSFCSQKFAHNNSRKAHERQHHSEKFAGPMSQKKQSRVSKPGQTHPKKAVVPAPLAVLEMDASGGCPAPAESHPQLQPQSPSPQGHTVNIIIPSAGDAVEWDAYCVREGGLEQVPTARLQAPERQYSMEEAQQLVTGTGELPYTLWTQSGTVTYTARSET